MNRFFLTLANCAALTVPIFCDDTEEGFQPIFDGKSFEGWKMSTENTNAWKIAGGAIVANGNRSHLFYVGDGKVFRDFELKVDVMTKPNSNGGIYFHTRYQEND